jgi:D-3-phosphoglycerate dehydrogenase
MYKIKTFNKISDKGLSLFDKGLYTVSAEEKAPDAIVLRSHKLNDDDVNRDICCIARAGAGVNNIPVEACSENGIVVFNTPGANANAVKELVICGLFLASRDVSGALDFASGLSSEGDVTKAVESNKSKFKGPEIAGKTLGVIGLGSIGVMVANAAVKLGMDVIGYDPFISVDSAWGLDSKVVKAADNSEIFTKSDYISIHVPLMDSTKGMINASAVSLLKDGARLLNFSRGGLVDSTAVLQGLETGKINRYVTDFPEAELLGHPGVVNIPHLGASTFESEENCAVMAVKQVREFIEKGNITNSVNFPGVVLEPNSPMRLCIIHRNIPSMLSQISSILADDNINIENMINKGHGSFQYTLVDTDSDVDENSLTALRGINGVIKVRTITF